MNNAYDGDNWHRILKRFRDCELTGELAGVIEAADAMPAKPRKKTTLSKET